jgi:hypothetical protein
MIIRGFESCLAEVMAEISNFLTQKNQTYGNSALFPVKVFSKCDALEQINVRIDDKLSRLMNGKEYPGDDTEKDLLGYLILKKVVKKYNEQQYKEPTTGSVIFTDDVTKVGLDDYSPRCGHIHAT